MQFIGYANSKEHASEFLGLLNSKGIPTYTKHGGSPWISPFRLAMFVCLDMHYDDARKLMLDRDHKVENPVDVDEFEKLMAKQDHSLILKWSIIILAVVVAVFSLVVYFVYKGSLQNA